MTGSTPTIQPTNSSGDARLETLLARSPIFVQLLATLRSWPVRLALVAVVSLVLIGLLAPWMTGYDPTQIDPSQRLRGISGAHLLGTDAFGRDIYARTIYGGRMSLLIGLGAAAFSIVIGLLFGVIAGYFRFADSIIMRLMDGIMAIPGILLAMALVSLSRASVTAVLIAVTVPQVPRVARLARSVMLSVRAESYVEAAISLGTRVPVIMVRHMMPNAIAPLIVQGTYIFASAMLTEAILSFLGVGIPPQFPSWGNVIAEGRVYFQLFPGLILYPGILLSIAVLGVNVLGDALRDALDPKVARRI